MSAENVKLTILKETIGCNLDEITLQWYNLTCSVKNNKNEPEKNILNNVCGSVRSKTFTAILGPSGAGKTTLLEGLSCRSGSVQGTVTVNGYFTTNVFMKEISAFLPQHDIAFGCLTAKEYLTFTCTMKLHKTLNSWERNLRIGNILHTFGLEKSKDTQLAKLSGGERRRLFLGAELVSDPPIIFCDEPTTGLDSYNALQIVSLLKHLSLSGKIIIISIHQPSSDLIKYFDNFILLSMGTEILNGNQETITSFFNRLNIICPTTCNIAEFYIQQISVIPGEEEKCIRKINYIRTQFLKNTTQNEVNIICPTWKSIDFKEKLKCPYHVQFLWLLRRESIIMKREFKTEIISILILIVTAFIIAVFYSSAQHNLEHIQDLNGFLYLIVSELLFTATYNVLNTFPHEIPIFKREKDLYSSTVYYLVKICSKIPQIIIYPYCFLFILYLIVPFNLDANVYIKIGFVMCIASFTSGAYGFMLSAIFDSTAYIDLITVPMDTIFLITSGIFININNLPYLLIWLKYISSFFYAFEAISTLYWNNFFDAGCSSNVPCVKNDTEIGKTTFQYVYNDYHYDLYSLLMLAIFMHCIGCLTIIRRKKEYSKRR